MFLLVMESKIVWFFVSFKLIYQNKIRSEPLLIRCTTPFNTFRTTFYMLQTKQTGLYNANLYVRNPKFYVEGRQILRS